MYTWRHNKVLEVIIELLRAQCETVNQQSITAKEPIIQFFKEGAMSCEETKKIPIWSYWTELVTGKFQQISKTSLQFPVHIIQTEKRLDIVEEECPDIQRRVCSS